MFIICVGLSARLFQANNMVFQFSCTLNMVYCQILYSHGVTTQILTLVMTHSLFSCVLIPVSCVLIRCLYPPQTLFVGGILFSRCPSVRPSVTLYFLNNSKSHCWIFIKPCKHVHICKTNTLDKKVRTRGQFY